MIRKLAFIAHNFYEIMKHFMKNEKSTINFNIIENYTDINFLRKCKKLQKPVLLLNTKNITDLEDVVEIDYD